MRPAVALVSISFCLFAQRPSVPYAQFFGPDFDNVHVAYSYPHSYQSIQKVDFRNLKLVVFDQTGKPESVLPFKDGRRKWKEKGEMDEATLEEVDYLPATGSSDPEYALVLFHWISVAGDSSTDGFAQVFWLADHALRVTQQLRWNEQFDTKEKYTFDAKTNTLIVRSAHYLQGDAHCCVSAMDVFTLRWNGTAFEQASSATELSDYGKRAGKTLPR